MSGRIAVTSLSHAAPFRHVAHAGGQYVLAHARALASAVDTVYFVPESADNAAAQADTWSDSVSVELVSTRLGRIEGLVQRALFLLDPYRWNAGYTRAAVRNPDLVASIRRSDIVEVQWVEYFRLVGFVRRVAPNVRVIGVVHDVVCERIHRHAINSPSRLVRWTAGVGRAVNRFRERRLISALDTAIVLSDKDSGLLADLGVTCHVEVVLPDLEEPGMSDAVGPNSVDGKSVIFVGAFRRPENETAAVHLIEEIWPAVVAAHPDATLHLVGSNPSTRMLAAAENEASVHVTGFVDSIELFYRGARCAVVPLRTGAGVKFKTLSAMLWGVPVVATPVGTEGIGEDSLFYAVSDTDAGLTDGLVHCLNDDQAMVAADRTRTWARARYTSEPFEERLREIYGRDLSTRIRPAATDDNGAQRK
ncbi:glycosyltransferase family 4 protein [Rhodococcus sp. ARC_M12]|uniref:glycosyltransferase n=1 Tax=Rhodococcus sp. ARC_M12 TaxID=2928854 RepID=UPI001FB414C8|nr:glycosyltransferase [Rhodococcus sp. ARC_M12]MCJ0978557.1 glycosyltransferase family 4 protein [Rhodococcus sp. ARC_M12]